MNFKKKFLTLSIKHQISLVIIINIILCTSMTIVFFSLNLNIIINNFTRKRREYIYQKFHDILESEIKFINFLLYQHEQLLKQFNTQIYYYGLSQNDLCETKISFEKDLIKNYKETNEIDYELSKKDNKYYYYLLSFSGNYFSDSKIYNLLESTHSSLDNKLKVLRNFRIPYLGFDFKIVNEYIFVHLADESLYSTNWTRIKEIEELSDGNISKYYDDLIENYVKKYKNFMNAYKIGDLGFIDIFHSDKYNLFQNYVNEDYLRKKYQNNIRNYLNDISFNFHFIDYITEKTFVTNNGNRNNVIFLEQNSIIPDYLNVIFIKILKALNIDVIPVFPENNTIISVNLCYEFLYKQMIYLNLSSENYSFEQKKLNDIYSKLKKGVSNIGDCILDKKYDLDTNQNAYDILNIKFEKFFSLKNAREYSLFKLSDTILGKNFICLKYTFPDFMSIINFKPYYFSIEQINLYCFKPFYSPKIYEQNMKSFFRNCQYFIVTLLLYLWILLSFYFFFRTKKLNKEIINPINNLAKVINNLEIYEKNMPKYEYDDSINDLFKICNYLLLGKYNQKMMLDSEIEKNGDKNEETNINDFNNIKINRKIIEDLIEYKNEYNSNDKEIITYRINGVKNDYKYQILNNTKSNIDLKNELIQRMTIEKKNNDSGLLKKLQSNIKKTKSIYHAINMLNQKMSIDVNLKGSFEYIIPVDNQSEEDVLELEILLNYKYIYDLVDLAFNYELRNDLKFIHKKEQLLLNSRNMSKVNKAKVKKKLSFNLLNMEDNKNENNDEIKKNEKDIKDDLKIRNEDFDRSVVSTYETKNLLFVWYQEAKYFKGVEFLKTNHENELNNLFNLFGNDNI